MRYVVRRLSMFLFTLWAAMTLNFFIPRFMPGNPLQALEARTRGKVSPATLANILSSFGYKPNSSLLPQYFTYLKDMVTGAWGQSIGLSLGQPVRNIVFEALPWTLGLIGLTTVVAFLLGNVVGIVAGWRRGGTLDSWLPSTLVITANLPYYWIGMLLILLFASTLGWLPPDFNYDPTILPGLSPGFLGSVLQHAVLPAFTLLVTSIGGWILTMRNNMITTLGEDYVRMARAKGLSNRRVMFGYAARNAFLPNLSGLAMSLGYVLTGAILVEYVFSYQGLGYLFYNSTVSQDYPLMGALFMIYTVAVLVSVLVCDFATFWLDPRARAKG